VSRILFAWELGAHLGHLSRNLPLARRCRDAGDEVVWAVPDLRGAARMLAGEGFALVQAPLLRPPARAGGPVAPLNFADLLLKAGHEDEAALAGALAGWSGLLACAAPAAIVYDHAPTALLAARAARIPVLLTGTGFELPPRLSPLPAFQPWDRPPVEALERAETALVARLNRALAAWAAPPIASVAELYGGPHFVTTFEALDVFPDRPGACHVGPLFALGDAPRLAWRTTGRPRVFVYARPTLDGLEALLAALQALDAEVVCAVADAPAALAERFAGMRWCAGPVDLASLLPEADLVATSGAGTISAALRAGVPVLCVPESVEQFLAGRRLEALRAGLLARRHRTLPAFSALLHQLLAAPGARDAAGRCASRWRDFDPDRAAGVLFDALRTLADSPALH
jgi:UDP:flavonoid glycosyltransferase YjiC (YdhE family)